MSPLLTILVCLCLLGCTSANRPSDSDTTTSAIEITGEKHLISELDVQKIIKAVQAIPRIDHNVLSIRVISANEVEVTTGIIQGPLDGMGDIVIVRKEKNGSRWRNNGVIGAWAA